MRLGLIGAGPWGRNYVRTIAALPGVALTAIASRNPSTKAIAPVGCAVRPNWRDLLYPREIDALIVATPPGTHEEIVLAGIDAGLPVLVEKPLTLDVASAERVVNAARTKSVLVMVDHVHLFHPGFQQLKRTLNDEQLRPRAICARAGDHGPYRPDVPVLWDWGPHDVAMCIDLLGAEPLYVQARMLERRTVGDAFGERIELALRFPRDVSAQIELSTLANRHRSFEVHADSRILRYDASPPKAPEDLPLSRAVSQFAQAVRDGVPSLASVELGAAVVRTLARA